MSFQLFMIGIPMSFLNMVLSIGGIIIQFVNNRLGTLYVATYAAANKIEQFIVQPMVSLGSATAVFAAQNYGAGKYKRIREGGSKSVLITFAWSIISAVLIFFIGKFIMAAVAGNESAELIDNGYKYLLIDASLSIILGPLVIYKCILQSVGRAVIPTISGFVEVFCRAGASLWLSQMFGFLGVCFANPAAWLGALIIIAIDYFLLMRKFKKQEAQSQA